MLEGARLSSVWMLLSYTLPAEPSSKRVLAWRSLRKLGALLEGGVWMLPNTPALEKEFRKIVVKIEELGGQPIAFYADDFTEAQGRHLRDAFNSLRRQEYKELSERCERFIRHVERLSEASDFEFGSIEELEEDLEKRRRYLAQIISRDAFSIPERREVEARLEQCASVLNGYIEQAYISGEGQS